LIKTLVIFGACYIITQ